MTDYAKMAAECRGELARVEQRLKQARELNLLRRDFASEKAASMWEDMRVELRSKIREFDRRAERQGKE